MKNESALGAKKPTGAYAYLVLALLVVVYTFNFIDRQILGILAGPIKKELGLTDSQLGLMSGLAFAVFYTGLGIPIAWLADRFNRTWIVTVALTLWSGAAALCGLAQNFTQLFLARVGVGVGEAGGVAPSYSIIADYFPPERRGLALGLFAFGVPIGTAFGTLFGGLIAHAVDWRMSFIVVGLAGVVIAPIFRLIVREPKRGQYDPPHEMTEKAPSIPAVWSEIMRKPSFWFLSFGAAMSSMAGYGLAFWFPSYLERSLHLPLVERSLIAGGLSLVGGVIGVWLGGFLGDKLAKRSKAWYALVPCICFMLTFPLFAAGILVNDVVLMIALLLIPNALLLAWLGPVTAAIQHLVAPQGRAVASSTFLFINNLIGLGLGTYVFGAISDVLSETFGSESLRYSILVGLSVYIFASLFMFLASRSLAKDWR